MNPEPEPPPNAVLTEIETTDGETIEAIDCTSNPDPTISIKVRDLLQLPSVLANIALLFLSTQTFVGGVSGVTATATPPATIAPVTKPIITFVKEDIGFIRLDLHSFLRDLLTEIQLTLSKLRKLWIAAFGSLESEPRSHLL